MPSRLKRAPDRLGAGYSKFQRRMERTTEMTDLYTVVPRLSRRVRGGYSGVVRTIPLPAVLGICGLLAVMAVVFLALGGSGSDKARIAGAADVDDARPVSLQVSGGFGVEGAFTSEPDPTDPNAGGSGSSTDPLSRLLSGVGGGASAGGSGGSGAGGRGTASSGRNGEAGAPVGILSNPELVKLFNSINLERTNRGLEPLLLDTDLTRSAQRHADWMAEHGVLCHSSECDVGNEPDASLWNGWSENIGYTVEPTDFLLFNAFKNSPPHLANMIDPRHHYVGLGWAPGHIAGSDRVRVFAVVQFGMQRR